MLWMRSLTSSPERLSPDSMEKASIAEVDASGYGKITNHGLDEELFESFV